MRIFTIFLVLIAHAAYADQYYQAPNGSLQFLSTSDVINGGVSLLPPGSVPITAAQAASIQQQQAAAAAAAQASQPNPNGFAQAIKTAMGGIVPTNTLMTAYPAFLPAVQQMQWADVQALILDAQARAVINATQYAAIKAAATANNIPITLP